MTRLLLHVTGKETRPITVDGARISLGRAEDCDIQIDEVGVSRSHAAILGVKGGFAIRDLGSRNGTYVNGKRVRRRRLSDGDRIRLAPTVELEFRDEHAGKASGGSKRAGRFLKLNRYFLIPEGIGAGDRPIPLHSNVTTVGSREAASICIGDGSVSSLHARLSADDSGLFVTDLKSRNGTRLNGTPVMRARLANGDIVQFGSVRFRVRSTTPIAWARIARVLGGAILVSVAIVGILSAARMWGDLESRRREGAQVRRQAVASVRQGIVSFKRGDVQLAQSYFSYAADLLVLADVASADDWPSEPRRFFRPIMADLPGEDQTFDFAKATHITEKLSSAEDQMPNREYVTLQCTRIAAALGQSPDLPPGFDDQVWRVIEETTKYPGRFQGTLNRSRTLNGRLRQMLHEAKLPEVFCYVAWVESDLRSDVASPKGARGLWQLMPSKAEEYGLRLAPVDERIDVDLSTRAATRLIGDLIRKFGKEQFMCALASYNRGENGVWNAMEKIPDPLMDSSKKFWYLVEKGLLPKETSEYVPRIFAAKILAESPSRFGLKRP